MTDINLKQSDIVETNYRHVEVYYLMLSNVSMFDVRVICPSIFLLPQGRKKGTGCLWQGVTVLRVPD